MPINNFWAVAWENAPLWRMFFAFFCGIAVGCAYFQSLKWSINHLGDFKHKIRMFALMAFLRISMFLGVLIMVCERNLVLILIYIIAFFITKMVVVGITRGHLIHDEKEVKQ